MTFGWEGFSFNHPEDWAPVVLSGNRNQGYVRISSPGRLMLQIRWRRLRNRADADGFLDAYLGRLQRDAKRADSAFTSSRNVEEGRVAYRYSGSGHGRGVLFEAPVDGRTFVLEIVSSKGAATSTVLREAVSSFQVGQTTDRWSAHGLDLELPKGLIVERREFLAGKTSLDWRAPGAHVHAERWGFADQLLSRHQLGPWTKALLRADRAEVEEEPEGLRVAIPGRFWGPRGEALVRHQRDRNQIVVLRADSRDRRWRPQWDWLN